MARIDPVGAATGEPANGTDMKRTDTVRPLPLAPYTNAPTGYNRESEVAAA
jgi:hypothetical protein